MDENNTGIVPVVRDGQNPGFWCSVNVDHLGGIIVNDRDTSMEIIAYSEWRKKYVDNG